MAEDSKIEHLGTTVNKITNIITVETEASAILEPLPIEEKINTIEESISLRNRNFKFMRIQPYSEEKEEKKPENKKEKSILKKLFGF